MIKVRRSLRRQRQRHHTGTRGTVRGLLGWAGGHHPGGHHANFNRILPGKMRELVEAGLFVRDDDVEGGYRITEKGLALLADLEEKEDHDGA